MQKYTIKDLTEGNVILDVRETNTTQIKKIMKAAFPEWITPVGNYPFYMKSLRGTNWIGINNCNSALPIQKLSDFYMEPELDFKVGDMIEVRDHAFQDWTVRRYLALNSDSKERPYCCSNPANEGMCKNWTYARVIKPTQNFTLKEATIKLASFLGVAPDQIKITD